VVLEFSGGEKSLYECKVQLDPTFLKFSETRLYVTQSRMVFELEAPVSVELSEIIDMRLERFYGEQFIQLKYKDLTGIHQMNFVCTGFGGIISNISRTIFLYKLIGRLKGGMNPRDIRFILSGSTIQLYTPWVLLALMLMAPSMSIILDVDCSSRLAAGIILLASFTIFAFTDVYKLLLGRLRWPIYLMVVLIVSASVITLWNTCSAREVMHSAVISDKFMVGSAQNPASVWYCVRVESVEGLDDLCIAHDDWLAYKAGDKLTVYYLKGSIWSTIIPYRYDDHNAAYVLKNRI
jgi:hypothetical protein